MSIRGMLVRLNDRLRGRRRPGTDLQTEMARELCFGLVIGGVNDDWYVVVPEWMRPEMIAKHGSVTAELKTFSPERRKRFAELRAIGIQFDTSGERHRWPWLDEHDTERAWWQAIA